MSKNQTVRMMTAGQMKDLASAIVQGIPSDLTFEAAQRFIEKKKSLVAEVRKIFAVSNPADGFSNLLYTWQSFYHQVFGAEVDCFGIDIPERQDGFDRLLVIAEGMTPQRLYDKCVELFSCWKWTDDNLDEVVSSERTAKSGAYAIWVRDRVEADEELKNISADKLKERNIPGITLEERLIYELKYFKETGKHLDIDNITLCSGSRLSSGGVPLVYWFRSEMRVLWAGPDVRGGGLRARQAVS